MSLTYKDIDLSVIRLGFLRRKRLNIIKPPCIAYILLLFVCTTFIQPSYAEDILDDWVENESVTVNFSNPLRSRRSPDATLDATIVNTGDKPLAGPLRFVITVFTPTTVTLSNSEGTLAGLHYFTLIAEGEELAVGASAKTPTMVVAGGGRIGFSIDGAVYNKIAIPPNVLAVDIVTPETLLTVGASPLQVSGLINNENAQLTLNGVPVTHQNGQFNAAVELTEGFNTIAARATVDGQQVTDSIVVSLDLTPPYLTIESHKPEQTVYNELITVTGLVNDIVRGTVEAEQAKVQVNGVNAEVSNRSYAANDILLTEGLNTIQITGADNVGNSTSISQTVIYKVISGSKLNLISGQDQTAEIGATLAKDLTVQLVDKNNAPIANETVVFRVVQGAGAVGAETDGSSRAVIIQTNEDGKASTKFQLGFRTGVANHKVKAKVVGYENEVIFAASATSVVGDKISVNSGNNQRGIIEQALPAPFIVAVSDSGANTVKGARVRFNVIKGEGLFQNEQPSYEVMTDSDGRASAQLTLGSLTGIDAQKVEAILLDGPEGVELLAGFSATAFIAAEPGKTSVSGVVLDNQDAPIPGVTVRIENTDRTATTNQQGRFNIEQAPVGPVHIIVDGSTATVLGEFPALSYHLVTVSGVDNPMSAPVYMVKLDTENGVMAGKEDVVLTLDNFPGFKLEIAKDSVTFPDGSREGIVSVTSVNASKVPMAPPNGMQPQFIVTIQPVGAVFSPAAKLTLPNIDGHAPGAQVEMYSFDHDLEEFVAIGLGTVSEDGSIVSSNPGVGVIKAGWHCGSQPGGSGTAHNCPECQKCKGSSCVRDPAQDNNQRKQQTPEDCKTNLCKGTRAEPGDIPVSKDVENDCKKPGCNDDSPIFDVPDDNDISEDDKKCSTCSNGEKIIDEAKNNPDAPFACGGGDPAKGCFTCKDGSCGNHCEASNDKEVLKVGIPGEISNFLGLLNRGAEKMRSISPFAMSLGVTGGGTMEQGEACCKSCVKTTPAIENKYSVDVEIKATATAFGGVRVPAYEHYFNRDERFAIRADAGLTGTVTGHAAPKYEYTEKLGCPDDENCHDFSAEVAVGGDISLGGTAIAAYQSWDFDNDIYNCSFYSREARKQPKNLGCWSTEEGLSGALKGGARISAGVKSSTNSCSGGNVCSWEVKPVEAYFESNLKFSFVFIEFEYVWKPEPIKLTDGMSGSCGS